MPYRQKTNLTRGRTVAAILLMVASLANTRSEAASFNAIQGGRPPSFAAVAKKTMPVVANISTTSQRSMRSGANDPIEDFLNRFFGEAAPRETNQRSLGSGIVISEDGEILTNYHLVRNADVIKVKLSDHSEHEARFSREGRDRARSRIYSTRIAEVENPDTPGEREKPVGQDGGYLWRLYTYWRFLERDGGTYVQCESITLTRGIPVGFGWLIRPFITSIPRESLEFTLATTRRTLAS